MTGSSCASPVRARQGCAADPPATSTFSFASRSTSSSAARVTTSFTSRLFRRRRRRSATRSAPRRSTARKRRSASLPVRSMARWSVSAARACLILEARVAAIRSCISTSSCRARSRRTSAVFTGNFATSKDRHRRMETRRTSSVASKTRWVAAVEWALPPRTPSVSAHPRWLEIAVPTHAEAVEAVSEILSRYGHNGIAVEIPVSPRGGTDHTVKAYLVEDVDAVAKVADARDALGHLQAFGLGPIGELAVRSVDDEDWLEAWKATVTPIHIGRFLVRPAWSAPQEDGAVTIPTD